MVTQRVLFSESTLEMHVSLKIVGHFQEVVTGLTLPPIDALLTPNSSVEQDNCPLSMLRPSI